MNNPKVYILKKDLVCCCNTVKIEKGKLVLSDGKYRISTLNGKTVIQTGNQKPQYANGISYGFARFVIEDYIKPCKLTCSDDEILVMNLATGGWNDFYYAIGRNPHEMYKELIKRFNYDEGTRYNTRTILSYEFIDDWRIDVAKVSIRSCYASGVNVDDSIQNREAKRIGNYMALYHDDPWEKFFKRSMV